MTNDEIPKNTDSLIESVTESAGELASIADGIPAPIKKNFWKAFGQLCTAATDVGVAYFEGKASASTNMLQK